MGEESAHVHSICLSVLLFTLPILERREDKCPFNFLSVKSFPRGKGLKINSLFADLQIESTANLGL